MLVLLKQWFLKNKMFSKILKINVEFFQSTVIKKNQELFSKNNQSWLSKNHTLFLTIKA